jgi:hypothetical protein
MVGLRKGRKITEGLAQCKLPKYIVISNHCSDMGVESPFHPPNRGVLGVELSNVVGLIDLLRMH